MHHTEVTAMFGGKRWVAAERPPVQGFIDTLDVCRCVGTKGISRRRRRQAVDVMHHTAMRRAVVVGCLDHTCNHIRRWSTSAKKVTNMVWRAAGIA